MTRHVVSVDMQDPVEKVEHVLNEYKIASVPVVDAGRRAAQAECFGVISLRDIAFFHEKKKNPRSLRAWEICTHKPIEVSLEMPANEAARIMIDRGCHHLVVAGKKIPYWALCHRSIG